MSLGIIPSLKDPRNSKEPVLRTTTSACIPQSAVQADTLLGNELQYIAYLERTQHMCSQHLKDKDAVCYLLEWMIRMRIHLVSEVLTSSKHMGQYLQNNKLEVSSMQRRELGHKLIVLKEAHAGVSDWQSDKPNRLSRLKCVSIEEMRYREGLILQYQAKMREILMGLTGEIGVLGSEEEVSQHEHEVICLDFLLTAFQLNAVLIQHDFDMGLFYREAHLDLIMNSPLAMDFQIYTRVRAKYRMLVMLIS